MRIHRRHLAALAALLLASALAVAALMTFVSVPAGAQTASQAAAPCVKTSELTEHLGASNIAFLRKLLPCSVRKLRGGQLTTSAKLSAEAASFLNTDATLSITKAKSTIAAQAKGAAVAYCGNKAYRFVEEIADSSPPPVLTPAYIASTLANLSKSQVILHESGTVFGFAYVTHVEFNDPHRTNPVAFFLLGVRCF